MWGGRDPRGEEIGTNIPNVVFNDVDVGEWFDLLDNTL